jgi:hypothetical protein
VHLTDADAIGVTVTTVPTVTVKGVVEFGPGQWSQPPGYPPCDMPGPVHSLRAVLALPETNWLGPSETALVGADGRFEFLALAGPVVIRPGLQCNGARLERVLLDGQDVTDTPVDFCERGGRAVRVTFTDAREGIHVRVVDAAGRPVPEAHVAFVSADPDRRQGWNSATMVTAVSPQGWAALSLPPGDYLVRAVPKKKYPTISDVLTSVWEQPDKATLVEVTPGSVARVQVTVAP